MPIETEDDVILVRRAVRELAQAHGFDAFASAALTTAASELTRNVWVHARRGVAVLEEVRATSAGGCASPSVTRARGLQTSTACWLGGYSTARSMGLGLSGSRRLVDEFRSQIGRRPGHDGGDRQVEVDLDPVEARGSAAAEGIPVLDEASVALARERVRAEAAEIGMAEIPTARS